MNAGGVGKAFFGPGYVSFLSEINHNIALTTGGGTGVISLDGGDIQCNSNRVTQVGTPTASADALRFGDLITQNLVSVFYSKDNTDTPVTALNGTSWSRSFSAPNVTMTAASGSWVGILIQFDNGGLVGATVDNSAGNSITHTVIGSGAAGLIGIMLRQP